MESINGQIIIDIPGFRFTWNDLACFVIGYKTFKAVDQKRGGKGVICHVGVNAIRLVIQYKGKLLCICQLCCFCIPGFIFFRCSLLQVIDRCCVCDTRKYTCDDHSDCQKKAQSFFHILSSL